ncbi:hypothetical protein ACWEQL_38625 [Kitasatospora sp. NPDC004240]
MDGDDEARVFVSDAAIAARSSSGSVLVDGLTGRDEADGSEDTEGFAVAPSGPWATTAFSATSV